MGMSSRDIGRPVRFETRETTGRNSAAAPTFCMNDEITPTVVEIMAIRRASVRPPYLVIQTATTDMTPVLSSPAPMIMTAMMEITALLAKPSNRCLMSIRFSRPGSVANAPSRTMTTMAATSTRTISDTKRNTVKTNRASTTAISTERPRDSSIMFLRAFRCTGAGVAIASPKSFGANAARRSHHDRQSFRRARDRSTG